MRKLLCYCQFQPQPIIEFDYLEHLVISHPNSDFLYQELVQSWFASIPSTGGLVLEIANQRSCVLFMAGGVRKKGKYPPPPPPPPPCPNTPQPSPPLKHTPDDNFFCKIKG